MLKVTLIGHLDWKTNVMIGATVKARNLYNELRKQCGEQNVDSVDIYEWKKHYFIVFPLIIAAFFRSKNIILVMSRSNSGLTRLFSALKKVGKNKIFYVPVGGNLPHVLETHRERIDEMKCIDWFFVETSDNIDEMEKLGFQNVSVMRNFKTITPITKPVQITDFKFCLFSRINELKGTIEAINAVEGLRKKGYDCSLDIYGPVEKDFEEQFQARLRGAVVTKYCGIIESEHSVEALKDYYCLLFPTKYETEGIPGTVIDAFASGVPVICSDWPRRKYVVTDQFDGLVYSFSDQQDGLKKMIQYSMEHPEQINGMRENCLATAKLYRPEIAIQPLVEALA